MLSAWSETEGRVATSAPTSVFVSRTIVVLLSSGTIVVLLSSGSFFGFLLFADLSSIFFVASFSALLPLDLRPLTSGEGVFELRRRDSSTVVL